jgi:gluconolactonase
MTNPTTNKKTSNILVSGLNFPEGPVFAPDGSLWFVEINGGNLSRWDGQKLERFDVEGRPNGAMIDSRGNIWFCDSGRGEIRIYSPDKNTFETICNSTIDGTRLERPNDLIFDSNGNLLFSDHADGREVPLSLICVLPKSGSRAKIISEKKYFTNGLALKKDKKTLIFSETYRQQLWIGEWDAESFELRNERPFAKAGNGPWGPDGIAFDAQENLFVTIFNEGRINIYRQDGTLLDWLKCPGNRPTSCAFDPSGKLGLVVTEAEHGEIISFPQFGKGLPIFYG